LCGRCCTAGASGYIHRGLFGFAVEEVVQMQTAMTDRVPARRPAFQGYLLLRIGFVVAPILFGLDKFFNWMVSWPQYLAPWLDRALPGSAQDLMYVVGAIEVLAGLLVLISPKWGSLVVAIWLAGIIVNLLTANPPEYYDIALRDFGLFLGALTLNRLATAFGVTTVGVEIRELRTAA
jgi:uncharacterized membrane protein YphA (DoxX/SURF4 family)